MRPPSLNPLPKAGSCCANGAATRPDFRAGRPWRHPVSPQRLLPSRGTTFSTLVLFAVGFILSPGLAGVARPGPGRAHLLRERRRPHAAFPAHELGDRGHVHPGGHQRRDRAQWPGPRHRRRVCDGYRGGGRGEVRAGRAAGPDGFHFTVLGEPGQAVRIERNRDVRSWEVVTTVPSLPASGQAL